MSKRELTADEFNELERRYPHEKNSVLMDDFDITAGRLQAIQQKLGWRKSKDFKVRIGGESGTEAAVKFETVAKIIAGMGDGRRIFSGTLYTKGNRTVHIGL